MGGETVLAAVAAGLGLGGDAFGEAAVEALDHAVGLGAEGPCEDVADAAIRADAVEVVAAGCLVDGLAGLVDGKAVGEFRAVVGQDRMHRQGEGGQEAGQEPRGRGGFPVGQDFEIDEARRPVDGDIGIGALPV